MHDFVESSTAHVLFLTATMVTVHSDSSGCLTIYTIDGSSYKAIKPSGWLNSHTVASELSRWFNILSQKNGNCLFCLRFRSLGFMKVSRVRVSMVRVSFSFSNFVCIKHNKPIASSTTSLLYNANISIIFFLIF